jgi:hypothetical protein
MEKQIVKQTDTKKKKSGVGKGKTNNPNGRPKLAFSVADNFRKFLEGVDPELKKIRIEVIQERAYQGAISEDKDAKGWAEFLANRAYGTPVNSIELTGKDGGAMEYIIKPYVNKN